MNKTIYVTGANGFVGKHLVSALEKYQVIKIPHDRIYSYAYKPFHTFFYLSAYGNHYHQKNLKENFTTNIHDLFLTLMRIKDLDFHNFIHISTSSVTLKEQTMYSTTKRCAELLVQQMARDSGKRMFSVRPSSLTGIGEQEFHLIPTLIRSCLLGERMEFVREPTHDFVDIEDFISALFLLIGVDFKINSPISISSGRSLTNQEVRLLVEKYAGRVANLVEVNSLRSYDNSNWVVDNSEILKLGWRPKIELSESIRNMIASRV